MMEEREKRIRIPRISEAKMKSRVIWNEGSEGSQAIKERWKTAAGKTMNTISGTKKVSGDS